MVVVVVATNIIGKCVDKCELIIVCVCLCVCVCVKSWIVATIALMLWFTAPERINVDYLCAPIYIYICGASL